MGEQPSARAVAARLLLVVLILSAVVGGAVMYTRLQATIHRSEDGSWQGITIAARGAASDGEPPGKSAATGARLTIRLATYNLDGLDQRKLARFRTQGVLIPLLSEFDLVALQGIRPRGRAALGQLVEQLHAAGRHFAFVTARDTPDPVCGFLFDRDALDIDSSLVETAVDAQARFRYPPLIAWFRVRGPDPREAFTFKVVNVFVLPERSQLELPLLGDLYRAVRDEGGAEDDVVLLGSFAADPRQLNQPRGLLDVFWAVADSPTRVDGGAPVDNILIDRVATCEFSGRAEVLDVVRQFDLTAAEAQQVSSHLPVWAEFHCFEGPSSWAGSP